MSARAHEVNPYDPTVQCIKRFDRVLAHPNLDAYVQYAGPQPGSGLSWLPGSLQTEAYAHLAFQSHEPAADAPAVENYSVDARLRRLALLRQGGKPSMEFFLHEGTSSNHKVPPAVIAGTFRHIVDIIGQGDDMLHVGVVQAEALAADTRLDGLQTFVMTHTTHPPVRDVWLDDLVTIADTRSREFVAAPIWSQALGEIALGRDETADWLLSEARRLESLI